MLGFTEHPQHVQFVPNFCKKFASIGDEARRGLESYRHDVIEETFPGKEGKYSPYILPPKEVSYQSIATAITCFYYPSSSLSINIYESVYRQSC